MANLAQIQSIAQGQFFVKDSLGNLVELKVGDTVSLNDTIVAANSNTDLSKIEILFDTNELITLSQGEQLLDATLLASTFGNEELAFDKQEVDETLNAWNNAQDGDATDMETAAGDVTEQATNAGNEEAADGGALRSKFNSRDGDATDIVSDLRAAPFGGATTQEPQEQIPTELLNPTGTTTTLTTPTIPGDPSIPVDPKVPASTITLTGSEVIEGEKITITATVDKPVTGSDLVIKLDNGEIITIPVGETTGKVEYESREDDVYVQGTDSKTVGIESTTGGNYEALDTTSTTTVTVKDDIDPVDVTITATVTTPKIIDVKTITNGTAGVKITGIDSNGKTVDLSIIKDTNHDGFGVETKNENGQSVNLSNGDTKELGKGEKIVVEFTDGKDVNSLDVSFAWRNNHETAKLTFVKGGQVVGFATVDGDGSSTTKAIVKYYDKNNNLIKTQEAEGSSDRVDKAFTFELPDSNGGIVSFDKVEFSAPENKDDYLIHEIKYKEVLDTEVTDVVTKGGDITFNIQVDENYPPQGKAYAYVSINGGAEINKVELNSTGRGTLTIDSKKLGDLSNIIVKVVKVEGGNYEKVNPKDETFSFTPTLKSTDDTISTDEDVPYTLTINDFGDITGISTKTEFKIIELPTNGNLFLTITTGETIFDKEGNKITSTKDETIQISKNQILTLGQISDGKVTFIPTKDTDADSKFSFKIGQDGDFAGNYTTTIIVKAVADAPTVSIDVEQIIAIKNGVFQKNDGKYYEKIEIKLPSGNIANNGNKEPEKFDLGGKTNSVKLDMKLTGNENGNGQSQANGKIVFYNGNVKVGEEVLIDGSKTYENGDKFDSFKIVHTGQSANETGGNANGTSSIHFAKDSKAIAIIEVPASDAERPTNDYNIDIYAALNDRDGSETLSVVIKNVPVGATLKSNKYDIIYNKDGSYTVKVPAGAKDISDTLTLEGSTTKPDIEIVATATEKNDNDGSNFKTSTASDSANSKIYTVDETSSISVNTKNTNLIFTLDITSSLVYNDYYNVEDYDILYEKGNDVLTSLHILQKSAISTIKAYEANAGKGGVVNVNMTIFSKTAHNLGWMTSKQALEYLRKLTQDSEGIELKPYELDNKLTKGTNLKPIIGQDGKNLTYENLEIDAKTTNYKNAIDETVKVGNIEKSGNNVGYFISDGRPWDDSKDTPEKDYSISKDYTGTDSWNNWKLFIQKNKIDLKVIGVGTPHDNDSAKSFLEEIQYASGHRDIILIDEPTSMETIFLSTVDGTVSGDISDNIFGGDGKVTIDSIVVGGTIYNKDDYPYGLSTDELGGKLTFDFETGKYAYNGNGEKITTDISKSFQVNVSDEDGDKGSLDVNFELKAQPITDGLVKFEKGGDINLSNLENIVKLKEINLDNGKENKLNLTLDDVLKLSGNDKQIKITGDQFDSVAFKDDGWKKSDPIVDTESGTQVVEWTNTRDESVSVKVEQPISDSITN
ncbi:hypothetical protein NG749_04705 [Aliarcobacter cryaerophilus]|uniref:immunoglobulin-like domain-containing protein n=1 Tax=Aliarcobacter cryaerophilus TaxID=28198 RepID=UPI003DA6629C